MKSNRIISPFDRLCCGAIDGNHYVVALNLAAAKVPSRLGGAFTQLDGIMAFDGAENARAYMGQVNMITVSSFCSPSSFIWGHHLASVADEPDSRFLMSVKQWDGQDVPVHSGDGLVRATASLFGTSDNRLFPLAPGTHCPTACKTVVSNKPGVIYTLVGIGISRPNTGSASIFMEDADFISPDDALSIATVRAGAISAVAESVMAIAANQKTKCERIYASYVELEIGAGETGCAGVFMPYIALAKDAVPVGGIRRLQKLNLSGWQSSIKTAPSKVRICR